MIKNTLYLQKKKGETPLVCMERFRAKNPEYEGVPMTYAGRLDPIATGELVVLAGEECKKKDEYLGLDKEYKATVLFGFETDTYDILGVPSKKESLSREKIEKKIREKVGTFVQKYPPYSSKKVQGKQLHTHAREGGLDNIEIPVKEVEVYSVAGVSFDIVSGKILLEEITETVSLVEGDFRQDVILEEWRNIIDPDEEYLVLDFTVVVSSGTYIRGIAHDLGGALLRLNRTKTISK